jgi:hypothetical protein
MSRPIVRGSTDQSVCVRIIDSGDGTPELGVTFSAASMWYQRDFGAIVPITEVSLASLATAHADGGFVHISDGYYRQDLPDAAVATGASSLRVGGAVAGMIVIGAECALVDQVALTGPGHVTPADGSITAAKIAAGAITPAAVSAPLPATMEQIKGITLTGNGVSPKFGV